FLDASTEEKSQEIKLIVTERWQLPSQMPLTHADYLDPRSPKFLPELHGLIGKDDFMTWSFYGGTTEQNVRPTRETMVFMFAMKPEHIRPMMDDLQNFDPKLVEAMQKSRNKVVLGKGRMQMMNMRVGDKFKIYSFNYKGIDLEFEIVGEIPGTRYDLMGIMN